MLGGMEKSVTAASLDNDDGGGGDRDDGNEDDDDTDEGNEDDDDADDDDDEEEESLDREVPASFPSKSADAAAANTRWRASAVMMIFASRVDNGGNSSE